MDFKTLADTIYTRQSTRAYLKKPAPNLDFEFVPLIKDIKVRVEMDGNYISFYSEHAPMYLENIGFIGQQIDLALQAQGLGVCWLGVKKPRGGVITMVTGYPKKDSPRKYPDGFKRKTAQEITINSEPDDLIEAVRIAPSAINLQPWLVEKAGNKYNFYLRNPKNPIEKMISNMRRIDMGIALAHLYIKARALGHTPTITFDGADHEQGKFIARVELKK